MRIVWMVGGALTCSAGVHAATVVADYRFNGSLNSGVGGTPALTFLGGSATYANTGPGGSSVLNITNPSGVELNTSTLGLGSGFSIGMLFSLDTVGGGYQRLINTNGVDWGLYEHLGVLKYYNLGTGSPGFTFTADQFLTLIYTYDPGTLGIKVYVNQSLVASFADSTGGIVSNTLRILRDNSGEDPAGKLDTLVVWSGVLSQGEVGNTNLGGDNPLIPLPSAASLAAVGIAVAGSRRRR